MNNRGFFSIFFFFVFLTISVLLFSREVFCSRSGRGQHHLGSNHSGISGITALCLHPIHHKLSGSTHLRGLSASHFLAQNQRAWSILGSDDWFGHWADQVTLETQT